MKAIKYNYNIDLFKTKNETFYYLLGAFITDGGIVEKGSNKSAYQLGITSIDYDYHIKQLPREEKLNYVQEG